MINVGRQLKAGFRSVLQEQGQEVVIISHWKTPFQVINRVKGVKSNKEGRPDYSVFQFTEAYSLENGSIIYVPKNDTYWRVYETEDRILGNVYVLFEAKTNKTWLEMDEKEFEELILGAEAPNKSGQESQKASVPSTPNQTSGKTDASQPKPPVPASFSFTPPKTPSIPTLKSEQEKESSRKANSPATANPDSAKLSKKSEKESEAATEPPSDSRTTNSVQSESATPAKENASQPRGPKLPFRKRSDQLYVSRQIKSLVSAIPKAELDERLKSETISALKAIEGLLVDEVTDKEKSQAEKRLDIVIGALDKDLEFTVNVASHLPPIFTYFGLEIK